MNHTANLHYTVFMKSTVLTKYTAHMKYTVPQKNTQQGALMLACLAFLAAMSIVAISSMDSSMLDAKMSSNAQNYNGAFNAAETALAVAQEDAAGMTSAVVTTAINTNLTLEAERKHATVTVTLPSTSQTSASATLEELSDTPQTCSNTSALCCIYFKAVGFGKMKNNDMRAVHELGFYRKVPCLNSVKQS